MAMVIAVRPPTAEVLDARRTDWVRQYRDDHAPADLWARGLRHVSHSMETQERVFRIAEQLERHGSIGPICSWRSRKPTEASRYRMILTPPLKRAIARSARSYPSRLSPW
jgi:hypothetical protein